MADSMSTVGDLMDYLATQPRDRKVILQKDGEGNDYSPLSDAGEGLYLAESTWSGEVYMTPEEYRALLADPASGITEEDEPPDADVERVVVLGPVN